MKLDSGLEYFILRYTYRIQAYYSNKFRSTVNFIRSYVHTPTRHTQFRGMFSAWKFHVSKSYNSLVTTTKMRTEGHGSIAYSSNPFCLRLKLLQDLKWSLDNAVFPSQVCSFVMLFIVTEGNRKLRLGHAKFGKSRWSGLEAEIGRNKETRTQTAWWYHEPSFPQKGKWVRNDGIFKIPFQRDASPPQQFLEGYGQNRRLSESYAPASEGGVSRILHRFR